MPFKLTFAFKSFDDGLLSLQDESDDDDEDDEQSIDSESKDIASTDDDPYAYKKELQRHLANLLPGDLVCKSFMQILTASNMYCLYHR